MKTRLATVLVLAVALALGLWSESVLYGWGRPGLWVPDLAVGMTYIVAGLIAWARQRGTATLLVLVGVAWFAGGLHPAAVWWHRGVLVALVVAYPGWRSRTKRDSVVIALSCIAAVLVPTNLEVANAAFFVPALLVVVGDRRGVGSRRPRRPAALWAISALVTATCLGTFVRAIVANGSAVQPMALLYDTLLVVIAIEVAVDVRRTPVAAVTDLVVELEVDRSGNLPQALAALLGDPALEVGYWSPAANAYLDATCNALALPTDDPNRVTTVVGDDSFAMLVHDRAVLDDPALREAVAAAAMLTRVHSDLQAEVSERARDLAASRRRLLMAGDDERRELERRLHDGPQRRLGELVARLDALAAADEHLAGAREQLHGTLEDLTVLARGLHPRELADGLSSSLQTLAHRSPVPVRLSAPSRRYPPEVESAAWYICSEALANVQKHAAATDVVIDVEERADVLSVVVIDNGRGGASASRGSGLRGLADRVEGLGGHLMVQSPPGGPTRLVASIPIGDQPR
jgi:signal transduction histidine kinase